jgi:Zn-dependent protease
MTVSSAADSQQPLDAAEATQRSFVWNDAHGVTWTIKAGVNAVSLSSNQSLATIPMAEWNDRIHYNEITGHYVFRFDMDDRQVGFMVRPSDGNALLEAMGWANTAAIEQAERLRALHDRPQNWPTVTTAAMTALFCGAFSSVVLVGLLFVIPAFVAALTAWRQARDNARLVHVRLIVIAALVMWVAGMITQGFAWEASQVSGHGSGPTPAGIGLRSKVAIGLILLLSLSVHEAAHAVSAWWCGDDGPLSRGRVTLNPLAHIDPVGTILVPLVLFYMGTGMMFGWAKPVMVSLHNVPRPRRANVLISAAGPASNLILASLSYAGLMVVASCLRLFAPDADVSNLTLTPADVHIAGCAGADAIMVIVTLFKWGFLVNIALAVFNMMPIPPLDGSHVLAGLMPGSYGKLYYALRPYSFIVLIACIYMGIIRFLMKPVLLIFDAAATGITRFTGY